MGDYRAFGTACLVITGLACAGMAACAGGVFFLFYTVFHHLSWH